MKKLRTRAFGKVYQSASEAVSTVHTHATIAFGGFGYRGVPDTLTEALSRSPASELSLIACDPFGLETLLQAEKAAAVTMSYIQHPLLQQQLKSGLVKLHLTPMGSLVEKLRAGGAGIPGFFTKTGVGTWVETGEVPVLWKRGKVAELSTPKETREFAGRKHIFEESLRPDFGFVRAWKADRLGNLIYRDTARNFNPSVARAAKVTVAEVEEIVEIGTFRPEDIHTPCCYVHRLVVRNPARPPPTDVAHSTQPASPARLTIARRAAREVLPGYSVNLGIGVPTLVPLFLDASAVNFQSENGILRMGPTPPVEEQSYDLVNAGRQPVSLLPGAALFDSSESFAMIRSGHIDVSILGAFQISAGGDLANWTVPGQRFPGIGGAMDLAASGSRIIALLAHCDERGQSKLVEECSLPVTGRNAVEMAITEKAVFRLKAGGRPVLEETAKGISIADVRRTTGFDFSVSPTFRPSAY